VTYLEEVRGSIPRSSRLCFYLFGLILSLSYTIFVLFVCDDRLEGFWTELWSVHIIVAGAARRSAALMVGSTIFLKIKAREELLHGDQNGHNTPTLPAKPSNLLTRISVAQPHYWTPSPPPVILMLMESTNEWQSIGGHKTNILPNHIPKPAQWLLRSWTTKPSFYSRSWSSKCFWWWISCPPQRISCQHFIWWAYV